MYVLRLADRNTVSLGQAGSGAVPVAETDVREQINAARANTGGIFASSAHMPAANTRYEAGLTSHRETRSFLSLCFGTPERSFNAPQ